MAFPLAAATPSSLGLDTPALDRLQELITRHLAEGRYPGAQIALARDGKLAVAVAPRAGDIRGRPGGHGDEGGGGRGREGTLVAGR